MAVIRTHYLDASAIVKLLIQEDGSQSLRAYLGPHATRMTTSLCFAETLGVLKAKHVHGHIAQEEYLAACEDLMAHLRCGTLEVEPSDITSSGVFNRAEQLALRHGLDISDAYQLLTLREGTLAHLGGDSRPILVTADRKLACAAKAEGLRAWDCMHEGAP